MFDRPLRDLKGLLFCTKEVRNVFEHAAAFETENAVSSHFWKYPFFICTSNKKMYCKAN
jgi:hypothetical protein